MTSEQKLLAAAERAVAELRRELERDFGWTRIELELSLAPHEQGLIARGTVVVERVCRRLRAALLDALPEGYAVDTSGVVELSSGEWRSLPDGATPVYRALFGRSLSTELLPEDGQVELLTSHHGLSLVRGIDATVGWIERALGPAASAPTLEASRGTAEAVVAHARAFLDTPYLLGGATAAGIDCSALVQRAFARGFALRLPRHSTDQLGATLALGHSPEQTGDLVFAWTEREGPCHVGIVVEGPPMTVLHASHSRKRVVEDPLERFLEGAERTETGPLSRVLDFHAGNVGLARIALPGAALDSG